MLLVCCYCSLCFCARRLSQYYTFGILRLLVRGQNYLDPLVVLHTPMLIGGEKHHTEIPVVYILKGYCLSEQSRLTSLRNYINYMVSNNICCAAFQFIYMTLAIDIIDGRGLSNKVRRELLPKKSKVMLC